MAANPDKITQIVRGAVNLYRAAEHGILRLVTRALSRGNTEEPQWAQDRMAAVGSLRNAAQDVLGQLRTSGDPYIRQAIAEGYREGSSSVLTEMPADIAARLAAKDAGRKVTRIPAIEALAGGLVDDFGARHSNVVRDVVDDYRKVIAEATSASIAGGLTRREASQLAYARLVDRGLTSFVDSAGRRWRLSSYVEMAVRTVTQRAAIQGQVDKQIRLGLPFVIISNEVQECIRCRPFEGQILRIDDGPVGRITVAHQTTGKPISIHVKATIAAARAAGLFHPNCRHSARAYLPGVTKQPDRPTADPAGDAARQRQRAIERLIRQWKERETAGLTPQAQAQARARVRLWQAAMRDHLAAHPDLKRLTYREQIGAGNLPPLKAPPAPKVVRTAKAKTPSAAPAGPDPRVQAKAEADAVRQQAEEEARRLAELAAARERAEAAEQARLDQLRREQEEQERLAAERRKAEEAAARAEQERLAEAARLAEQARQEAERRRAEEEQRRAEEAARQAAEAAAKADSASSFEDQLAQAATDEEALEAAPFSLVRTATYARPGSRKGFTPDQREAVRDYQGPGYIPINGRLRDLEEGKTVEDDAEVQANIRHLDTAMAGSRLTRDVLVYRGVRKGRLVFGSDFDSNLTGLEWFEAAFVSTTADENVINGFASNRSVDPVQMRILVPKGVAAIQVSGKTDEAGQEDEAEVLLERGRRMRVVADYGIVDGVRRLDVEVLPE